MSVEQGVPAGYKRTEVGVIPGQWAVARLGDLAIIRDGTHQTPHYVTDGVPFYSVEHVTSGDFSNTKFISEREHRFLTRFYKIERGDVLMTRIGSVGQCRLVDWEVNASFYVSLALLKIHGAEPAFVCQYSGSSAFKDEVDRRSLPLATPKKINLGPISEIRIPVPPVAEQRAIADALGDMDALLDALDRLIAKQRDLKQTAMQQLLTGRSRLPGFTGEWQCVNFGDVAQIRNAKVVPALALASTRCVELDNLSHATGRLLGSISAIGTTAKYAFQTGDVLFGRLRAYLRKYWLATFDGLCSTEIWPLVPRDGRLHNTFLHLIVQTDQFVDAAGVSYGTHMPRSDWTVLRNLEIHLPPIAEQTAIAAALSDMGAEIAALEARRAKTVDLKQAVMQQLLTGRTRLV